MARSSRVKVTEALERNANRFVRWRIAPIVIELSEDTIRENREVAGLVVDTATIRAVLDGRLKRGDLGFPKELIMCIDGRYDSARNARWATVTAICSVTGLIIAQRTYCCGKGRELRSAYKAELMTALKEILQELKEARIIVRRIIHDDCKSLSAMIDNLNAPKNLINESIENALDVFHCVKNFKKKIVKVFGQDANVSRVRFFEVNVGDLAAHKYNDFQKWILEHVHPLRDNDEFKQKVAAMRADGKKKLIKTFLESYDTEDDDMDDDVVVAPMILVPIVGPRSQDGDEDDESGDNDDAPTGDDLEDCGVILDRDISAADDDDDDEDRPVVDIGDDVKVYTDGGDFDSSWLTEKKQKSTAGQAIDKYIKTQHDKCRSFVLIRLVSKKVRGIAAKVSDRQGAIDFLRIVYGDSKTDWFTTFLKRFSGHYWHCCTHLENETPDDLLAAIRNFGYHISGEHQKCKPDYCKDDRRETIDNAITDAKRKNHIEAETIITCLRAIVDELLEADQLMARLPKEDRGKFTFTEKPVQPAAKVKWLLGADMSCDFDRYEHELIDIVITKVRCAVMMQDHCDHERI